MTLSKKLLWLIFVLFFGMIIQACAKKNYIDVAYQLPAPSASQLGSKTCLAVRDNRHSPEFFINAAKGEFDSFSGMFNLNITSVDKKSANAGKLELEALFQKALTERLQNMGIEILNDCSSQDPVLRIDINRFQMDFINRKWKASVTYEASFTKDGKNYLKESVTGNAERVKVVGSKAAQKVVGELFTDTINRLDINRLFDQSI